MTEGGERYYTPAPEMPVPEPARRRGLPMVSAARFASRELMAVNDS